MKSKTTLPRGKAHRGARGATDPEALSLRSSSDERRRDLDDLDLLRGRLFIRAVTSADPEETDLGDPFSLSVFRV